jgi:DNA-binding NarL/FixJ family response regulator
LPDKTLNQLAGIIMAKIILAEDHVLVRQGLKRIIEEDPGLRVTHEAGDGLELLGLLEAIDSPLPDLIVLDISMPRLQGLEAAQIIKERYPAIKILILTMHREKNYYHRAREIGVHGYVLKEEADTDLNFAINTILRGDIYTSPLLS